MDHCGTQTLETSRLLLRPLAVEDADMMFGNWAKDPEVTRYLRWSPHRSWAESAEYLAEVAKHYTEPSFYVWGIADKKTGILFGTISLQPAEADPGWTFLTEPLGENWEPGYCIGRKWWNRGFVTEALCAVRDYWFQNTGSPWLSCCHAVENVASGAVMQKAGFCYDHDSIFHKFDGSPVPCRVYYLLKDETTKLQPAPAPIAKSPAAPEQPPADRPAREDRADQDDRAGHPAAGAEPDDLFAIRF